MLFTIGGNLDPVRLFLSAPRNQERSSKQSAVIHGFVMTTYTYEYGEILLHIGRDRTLAHHQKALARRERPSEDSSRSLAEAVLLDWSGG